MNMRFKRKKKSPDFFALMGKESTPRSFMQRPLPLNVGIRSGRFWGSGLVGTMIGISSLAIAGAGGFWAMGLLVAGIVGILTAILAYLGFRHFSDQQASDDRRLLLATLEGVSDAYLLTDREGRLVLSNTAYRNLFSGRVPSLPDQLKGSKLIGAKDLNEVLADLSKNGIASTDIQARVKGKFQRLKVQAKSHGGYIIWAIEPFVVRKDDKPIFTIETLNQDISLPLGFKKNDLEPLFFNEMATSITGFKSLSPQDLKKDKVKNFSLNNLIEVPLENDNGSLYYVSNPNAVAKEETFSIKAIFDSAPIAVGALDGKNIIVEVNSSFKALAHRLNIPDDIVGQSFPELCGKQLNEEVCDRLEYIRKTGNIGMPLDLIISENKEDIIQAYFRPSTLVNDDRIILYLIDTSEVKRLESKVSQAQKMQAVGQLAGGIAHDFNNLLTAIIGFCDLLLSQHGPGDPSFADLMQIKQNSNRAANLVRQLLAFSRRQTLRPRVLDVTDVLAELSNLIRRLIGEKIEFKLVHSRGIWPTRADTGQLEQVLINLSVNARDAMPDGGKLTIKTKNIKADNIKALGHEVMPNKDFINISVEDTGTGIPENIVEKIFEPFFTTKDVGEGTGLGLATVYGIVKQSGGFIFLDSVEGKGTTFNLYLPATTAAAKKIDMKAMKKDDAQIKDLTGRETILLVEDEAPVRMFASRALKNKGYEVLVAESGEDALEKIKEHIGVIDLMISDVVMPIMDGPTLAKHVREDWPEMKIIFISGYAEEAYRDELGTFECTFLAKPFTLTSLTETVKAELE
jgi:two-component system cell cycle sensor histidine kinase/response regulator CckA